MSFSLWNQRLLECFFGSFAAQQSVRLCVSRDLLDMEFDDIGGCSEFIKTVRRGPDWPISVTDVRQDQLSFYDRASGLHRQWVHRNLRPSGYIEPVADAPPFLPYLAMQCLAWTTEVPGLASFNFFDRLRSIYEDHGLDSSLLKALRPLWDGLENWSIKTQGEYGLFKVETLGEMRHVGVPKSQVILTARKLENLPSFFSALGLQAEQSLSASSLATRIMERQTATHQYLGRDVLEEIQDDSDIGRSAISQLLEHYQEWDGTTPEFSILGPVQLNGHSSPSAPVPASLVLGLLPENENRSWQRLVYISAGNLPDGTIVLKNGNDDLSVELTDGMGGPIRRSDGGRYLDPADIPYHVPLNAIWRHETDGERQLNLQFKDKPIRILCWNNSALVEQDALPAAGFAYLLVRNDFLPNLESWNIDAFGLPLPNSTLPQVGLIAGQTLSCIERLADIDDASWARFPDGGDTDRQRPKALRTKGGSIARATGLKRVYLPYDPPKVILESDAETRLIITGGVLEEQKSVSIPSWISATTEIGQRVFRVIPSPGKSVVHIEAQLNGKRIAQLSFGLLVDQDFSSDSSSLYKVNALGGRASDGEQYASGVMAPSFAPRYSSIQLVSAWPTDDIVFTDFSFRFLDWLASQQKVSFGRARDFCFDHLTNRTYPLYFSREIETLCQLGHIEIEQDSKGRWAYLHSTPACLYPLPSLRDGKHQFILGGTYDANATRRLTNAARGHSIDIEVHPQLADDADSYKLTPPRIGIVCSPKSAETICAEAKLQYVQSVPAYSLATWGSRLDEWRETLSWFVDIEQPTVDATYRPYRFRTMDGDEWPEWGQYNLARRLDPVTRRHFLYSLMYRDTSTFKHCQVKNRAFACWQVHTDAILGFAKSVNIDMTYVPIAYSVKHASVVVPFELELPLLLARALVLCGGLTPRRSNDPNDNPYKRSQANNEYGFIYDGACLEYRLVPPDIAAIVLRKVGARPVAWPSSAPTEK